MTIYYKVADIIDYMVAHSDQSLSLEMLSEKFSVSPTVFQKQFQGFVGVSPANLQRFMKFSKARDLLLEGYSTLDAAYEAGLSGNARLHDACVTIEAATPGELKAKGRGIKVYYGWHITPFGNVLIGATDKGLCWLSFEFEGDRDISLQTLQKRFPQADFINSDSKTADYAEQINRLWNGTPKEKIRLNLFGTNFQLQVWQALLKIPRGGSVSYGTIAEEVCTKKASRAVGSAVGANPISYIIPCHRVIQQSGIIENYAWGSPRKKVLLGLEVHS